MNTLVSIAERITMVRNDETFANFAKEIDCNVNTLRSYERGLSNPNFEFIQSICKVKNISTDWLIFGKGLMCSAEGIQHPESATESPKPSQQNVTVCAQCNELKTELELEKTERRGLSNENRELSTENRRLWKENGDLRERCARLEERQQCGNSGQ